MDNEPSIDRGLLIPILVGGFSVFGIVIVLLAGRLSASRALVPTVQTETPFRYIFLGTEPGIFTESPEAVGTELLTENPFASSTPIPLGTIPGLVTPTLRTPVPSTPNNTAPAFPPTNNNPPPGNLTSPANTAFPTVTSAGPEPLAAGTYEDGDYRLVYNGPWSIGQGTHVSVAIGSSLTFRYIGKDWRLRYQSGPGLGTMSISVDGTLIDSLNESDNSTQSSEWYCAQCAAFPNVTHTVVLTHMSGGSVNLDQVIVSGVATPTPTPTRTSRPQ